MKTIPPPPPKPAKAAAITQPTAKFARIAEGPSTVRLVLNCAEGWGKTTMLAHAPRPLIVMAPQESGLVTLRRSGRVPDVPVAQPQTWDELIALVRSDDVQAFDTVGFDALGGFEQMARDHVLRRDFEGSQVKFQSFGRGNATLSAEWMVFLQALERLASHASILIASHVEVASFNNPEGDNYGRFLADCSKGVWAATKRWADGVLFGTFYTTVDEGKGKGGTQRVLHTEYRATHDAKNRWGLPAILKVPDDPAKVYETVFSHINKDSK